MVPKNGSMVPLFYEVYLDFKLHVRPEIDIRNTFTFTVQEPVRLQSLIDVLFCKLHYGFGENRLPMHSKQASFSEFIIDRYNVSV